MDSTTYPKVKYSETGYTVVNTPDEEHALHGAWSDTPVGDKDENGLVKTDHLVYTPPAETDNGPGPLTEGHTYRDRTVWQAQKLGIKIDKRWSNETLLRKIAELQTLSKDGIVEANAAVPDEQELDYDPTISAKDREDKVKIDAAVEAATGKKAK